MPNDVELRFPAEVAYVSTLRATAASLAARVDLTVDDIEDLRMAVGEACAVVLPGAAEGGEVAVAFGLSDHTLTVAVSVPAAPGADPDTGGFAWQVLTALVTDAEVTHADGHLGVAFTMHSTVAP